MPDIRIINTGQIFYQVEPTLAAILCAAHPGLIERVASCPIFRSFLPSSLKPKERDLWTTLHFKDCWT